MKIEPVDSPIGRPTGTRKLRAAVTGRAVVGFQPCGGSQLCHKIPEPGGHGRTREDKTRLAIKCWRARKAGTRKDTPLRRFGTVRPRLQIPDPRLFQTKLSLFELAGGPIGQEGLTYVWAGSYSVQSLAGDRAFFDLGFEQALQVAEVGLHFATEARRHQWLREAD